MNERDGHRDFGWWLRLATIVGIISFAVIFFMSFEGLFRSFRIFPIAIRSLVGALAVAGVVALAGHFASGSGRRGRGGS